MKTLNYIALLGLTIGSANAALVNGDFFTGISSSTDPWLTYENDLNDGWISHDISFVGTTGVTGAATVTTPQAQGSIIAQVFDNSQSGNVVLNFDWAPSGSEELAYVVYGWTGTVLSGRVDGHAVYHNPQWSNNGPGSADAEGTTLVSGDVTGDTTSAAFDITGYNQVAVAFWQADSTTGGVLDNVSITPVPEPSSTALLGLGGLALILRRRK